MKLDVVRLDSLFVALRGAGLGVGVEEIARSRQVLELWGRDIEPGKESEPPDHLPVERWRSLLARVVVKKPEQGPEFERIFDLWAATAVAERPEPPRSLPPPRLRQPFVGALAFFLLFAWISPLLAPPPLQVAPRLERPPKAATEATALAPSAAPGETPSKPRLWLKVLPRAPAAPWPGWPELVLSLFLLALVGKKAADIEARPLLAPSTLPPRVEGPTRVLLSAPALDLAILEPEEREAIVWGVGRFVSEERTARIDLAATVGATAKSGGRLELRYAPRSWHREIWLWLDEAAADHRLGRVADEVEQALRRHGLPVERAFFRGVPEILYSADGRRFRPREIEDRRGVAQVAILTDGRLIGARLEGLERQPLEAIFRELGGWPRLALFLPESAAAEVWELAARHQVEVRRPAALAAFLSASRVRGGTGGRDVELWAAVCALSPAPVAEGSAEALRRLPALGIEASPWQIEELRTKAGAEAVMEGRLEWRGEQRRRRVEWLRGVELGARRTFDLALEFWQRLYELELKKRGKEFSFAGTLAEAQLRAERALLVLLERGQAADGRRAKAIDELFQLHQGVPALEAYLEKRLAELDTAEGSSELLRLDFFWQDLPAVQQYQLLRMRFAGREVKTRLRKPQRPAALLALGGGLAAGALAWAMFCPRAEILGQEVEVVGVAGVRIVPGVTAGPSRLDLELGGVSFSWRVTPGSRVEIKARDLSSVVDEWGIEMAALPGGRFWLGRRENEEGRPQSAYWGDQSFENEQPAHEVTLAEFWIDRYEVTHEQYRRFRPEHRSTWDERLGVVAAARLPVTDVDWHEATSFCTERGGRLPTEAEWEYAARAGTRTPWSFGVGEALLGDYVWYEKNASQPQPVGTRQPNPWGLYDVHGNVWEWTATEFVPYQAQPVTDPRPAMSVVQPVLRGGSFWSEVGHLRSATRGRSPFGYRILYLGFRCVRVSRLELGPSSFRVWGFDVPDSLQSSKVFGPLGFDIPDSLQSSKVSEPLRSRPPARQE